MSTVSERPAIAGHHLGIRRVTHRFGPTLAVDDVSIDVAPGEIVALLGPSGCGKTTLLRTIAGFIRPTAGEVLIDGVRVNDVPTRRRGVGIVFQSYALFQHLSVEKNIAYGLKARGAPRAEVASTVDAMLELVRLESFRGQSPRQLSGGQQQRVAVARALAVRPRILLLDEPFSALDRGLRLDMQIEIKRIQRELGITTVLVTHDQDEAMSMADRIAVMNQGRLCQFGPPIEVYDRPADAFVNRFIGSTNLLDATVADTTAASTRLALKGIDATVTLPGDCGLAPGAGLTLSVRPERWRLWTEPALDRIAGTVALAMPLGTSILYEVAVGLAEPVKVSVNRDQSDDLLAVGDRVHLGIDRPGRCPVFPRTDQTQGGQP